MNKFKLIKFNILIFFFFNINAFSDESSKTYINIDADKLITKQNLLKSEFIGNVYANDEVNQFWGDKMIIYYDENKKIKLINLEENVRIKTINEEAAGNFASYNPKNEIIEIIGDVVVFKDKNVLYGDKLTIDLFSSTSIIMGTEDKQVSVKISQ
jgi:lipopolysaccharide export system protein LptA